MVALSFLASCLLLATRGIQACAIEVRQADSSFITVGDDGPPDAETVGFSINHLCLVVKNLTASIDFYQKALGMRHIYTVHLSPSYSVTYMGHIHGGKNGTGYQTGAELLREKNNAAGMIELQHLANSENEDLTSSGERPNTFSHIGLIVPDLAVAQARMERYGVTITKAIGVPGGASTPLMNAFGVGPSATQNQTELDLLAKGQEMIGFPQLLVIQDPDGNMIEVQQLVPPPGVA